MNTPLGWSIGGWELILILGVFLLLFGSTKLPKLARALGSSMTEFKKGLKGEPDDDKKIEEGDESKSKDGESDAD